MACEELSSANHWFSVLSLGNDPATTQVQSNVFDTSWCGAEGKGNCRSLEKFGEMLRGRVSETEECLDYAKHVTEKPAD